MTNLREYSDATDRTRVIALWRDVFGYETAHNEPSLAIEKKLAAKDGLFFVAQSDGTVVGTGAPCRARSVRRGLHEDQSAGAVVQ